MANYKLVIKDSVAKDLRPIPNKDLRCILDRIEELAENPRPPGVDDQLRQDGQLEQMILDVPTLLAELSKLFELAPGDLVFTGTPAGVGPVRPGQRVRASIDGLPALNIAFAP